MCGDINPLLQSYKLPVIKLPWEGRLPGFSRMIAITERIPAKVILIRRNSLI